MKKNSFLLVGCGRIAQRHVLHIQQVGKLIAVCDIEKHKAESFAKKNAAKWYFDYQVMLKENNDADIVVICSPNGFHSRHSIDALNAGFHVLCEKPMAIHSYDCAEMIKAAENNNKQLFIVKQNRFNPPVVAVKKILDNNILGKIFSIQLSCFWNRGEAYYKNSNWKGSRELDGGTLYTQFSHFIDILYWMFGDIKYIKAITGNFAHEKIIEFEDTGVVIAEFQNGIIGTINYTVNAHGRNMEGSLSIFGEKGTVKIGGQYLNELEYQDIEGHTIDNLPAGNPANSYGQYEGSMSNHADVYKNLVEVMEGKASIAANGFEGLKTIEIIEKIYHSAGKLQ